jgi:phospholipase C
MRQFVAVLTTQLLIFALSNPLPAQAQSQVLGPVTPIEHLVVIFQENVSFDHYFGTYPNAANLPGEPPFQAVANTPAVNGLSSVLLTRNANAMNTVNKLGATNPFRLSRAQAATSDQNHNYGPEQAASTAA